MKFSDIAKDQWGELKPYLDTCLLPVTGLTGREAPFEVTEHLERLRDAMDCVEIPFKGRVVTYPAYHFVNEPPEYDRLNRLCASLKESVGFRYVVVMTVSVRLEKDLLPSADLLFSMGADQWASDYEGLKSRVSAEIGRMWQFAKGLESQRMIEE